MPKSLCQQLEDRRSHHHARGLGQSLRISVLSLSSPGRAKLPEQVALWALRKEQEAPVLEDTLVDESSSF